MKGDSVPYGIGRKAKIGPTITEVTNDIAMLSGDIHVNHLRDVPSASEEIAAYGGRRCIKLGKTSLLVVGRTLNRDQWISLVEGISGKCTQHEVRLTSRENNIRDAGGKFLTLVFEDIRPAAAR